MNEKAIFRNPFNRKQRTLIKWPAKKALEQYFLMQNKPSIVEIAGLAESLQLDNKVVRVWFYNRRQKEKSSRTCSTTSTSIIRMVPVEPNNKNDRVGFAESLATTATTRDGVDSGNFLSNGNVRRFSLGKPNGIMTQRRRSVLVLGNRGLAHQKFINQIINYIVNVKEDDKFQFQLVDDGHSGQTNRISVYDIHHADGFRIPYSLTIVVVSYSGDSGEDSGQLFRDQKMADVFNRFLEEKNGVQELDMICNLVISNNTDDNNRRPPFLSIFGSDVAENINNWELTESCVSDNRTWHTIIQHFFSVLAAMKPKSFILTKLVLEERKKVEGIVEKLTSLITLVLAKVEELNSAKQLIEYYQWQLELVVNKKVQSLSLDNIKREYPDIEYVSAHSEHLNSEMNFDDDPNVKSNREYHEAEMKWKASLINGQNLVKTLETDLLRNGTSMQDHFHLTWRSIQWLNSVALHGNYLFTQKIFDILAKAEELLKQTGF